jgi:hypothetical protein
LSATSAPSIGSALLTLVTLEMMTGTAQAQQRTF